MVRQKHDVKMRSCTLCVLTCQIRCKLILCLVRTGLRCNKLLTGGDSSYIDISSSTDVGANVGATRLADIIAVRAYDDNDFMILCHLFLGKFVAGIAIRLRHGFNA